MGIVDKAVSDYIDKTKRKYASEVDAKLRMAAKKYNVSSDDSETENLSEDSKFVNHVEDDSILNRLLRMSDFEVAFRSVAKIPIGKKITKDDLDENILELENMAYGTGRDANEVYEKLINEEYVK